MTLLIPWILLERQQEVDICGYDWNSSTTFEWIAVKLCTDVHVPLRINCNNFVDPLTFCLVLPWVKTVLAGKCLVFNLGPVKLKICISFHWTLSFWLILRTYPLYPILTANKLSQDDRNSKYFSCSTSGRKHDEINNSSGPKEPYL